VKGWGALAFGVLLAALLVFAVLSNDQEVTVVMPLLQWRTKLWGAMVASAIVGAGAAALLVIWPMLRLKFQSRRQTRRIAELEQEVHGLRTLPIASDVASSSSATKV
jgi:uncharacterized integral membrane protein